MAPHSDFDVVINAEENNNGDENRNSPVQDFEVNIDGDTNNNVNLNGAAGVIDGTCFIS